MIRRRHQHLGIVFVRGRSMEPTFGGVRRFPVVAFGREPQVGDVVVARRPDRPGQRVIKRITDRDERGWWVESDALDTGGMFSDSWLFGAVPDDHVLGVVIWPQVSGRRP